MKAAVFMAGVSSVLAAALALGSGVVAAMKAAWAEAALALGRGVVAAMNAAWAEASL
jgi:hypothetical protein